MLVSDAIDFVRKSLDELGLNDTDMLTDDNNDNNYLDGIIARTLPEAINEVSLSAPAHMLEGADLTVTATKDANDNKIVNIVTSSYVLRLLAFRAADSDIVVTQVTPEASPEGRMQLNPYTRGTYDNPRLVELQHPHGANAGVKYYRYYSLKATDSNATPALCKGISKLVYAESSTSYTCSTDIEHPVLLHLTGLVLTNLGQNDKAQIFLSRAKQFITE